MEEREPAKIWPRTPDLPHKWVRPSFVKRHGRLSACHCMPHDPWLAEAIAVPWPALKAQRIVGRMGKSNHGATDQARGPRMPSSITAPADWPAPPEPGLKSDRITASLVRGKRTAGLLTPRFAPVSRAG